MRTNISGPLIATIGSIALFGAFAWIMWQLGFFTFTGSDPSSKVVAAALGLAGALIGSLVTLVGLVLKYSIDERNAAIQEQTVAIQQQTEARSRSEAERTAQLAADAERRLKTEAAIQAVGLLSSSSGQDVSNTQRAGVILALADLEIFSLALSLTSQFLEQSGNKLDPGAACWVFHRALERGRLDVQEQAVAMTLRYLPGMLNKDGTSVFPRILTSKESSKLPDDVRFAGLLAVIDRNLLRPYHEWTDETPVTACHALHYVLKNDPVPYFREIAGKALHTFLMPLDGSFLIGLDAAEELPKVRLEVATYANSSVAGNVSGTKITRQKAFEAWAKDLSLQRASG